MTTQQCQLFVTADDRTGALEIGGIVAGSGLAVPVGPHAFDPICCCVDVATRHLTPTRAALTIKRIHAQAALHRCHKMDSGLRGNWPYEARALVDMGYRVAIVPSFPDAGRRCKDGIVYIDDVPVLDSPFGRDPLTAPVSSRPADVLIHAGCNHPRISIHDANDNAELQQIIRECLAEGKVIVGPTGAIGCYADEVLPPRHSAPLPIARPVLIVCGSLNATSREQLGQLDCRQVTLGDRIELDDDITVLATPIPDQAVTPETARITAASVARALSELTRQPATLIIIGGDTVAAVIEDETLEVLGTVDDGIAASRFRGKLLITKGGGIGTAQTLSRLLTRTSEASS